ncbi:GNAT family N-acetyltransferase [Caldimonas sp. KR1-144]|uniref:GNAT family N-acetyltransferase n=1 Tax=Caldimonas sp. KR1-144 TaxID=3400911 RepID=UPI003C00FD4D
MRIAGDPHAIEASAWDALLEASPAPTPFLRHAFLCALHDSGSAVAETGWTPCFATLERGDVLVAAAALYLKSHSYGEYVFDWAWADAWERAGRPYYPKLLGAVPFTPVPGSRLLAVDDDARAALLAGIEQFARAQALSSVHLLFIDEADRRAAEAQGWLERSTVQFHWRNREHRPYADFDDFLAGLTRDKRRKIAQERRYVREAGVTMRALAGAQITGADWDFFYRCYQRTYREHRSTPYLTRDFFARMARGMAEHWLLFIAERGDERLGCSLIALDPACRVAYGRYWGALAPVRCLHFEACYYAPLEWCIAQGYLRFEGGAQGEHKMARGLEPVRTFSSHWLAHPAFADAVARFLEREGAGVEAYVDELEQRTPFKRPA